MKILFIIGIIIINIIIHELAHALAMIKNGVAVEEIGIGIKMRFIPHLTIRLKSKINLVLSPFLLGAYVKPANEKEIESLSYKQKASIFGAGVIANLIFGFMLLIPFMIIGKLAWPAVISAIIAFLLFKWGRYFSLIMPILSIALMAFIIWSIIKLGVADTMVGPVGIVVIAGKVKSFFMILWLGIAISWGLGMVNMLPFSFLDGGQMLLSFIEKCFGKNERLRILFAYISWIIFFCLVIVVWFSDFARL